MKFLRKYANINIPGNLSSRFRRNRFQLFLKCLDNCGIINPKIVDIGGYDKFWQQLNSFFHLEFSPILVNISKDWINNFNYISVVGNGRDLSFIKDKAFDIAFSNSVIEHISKLEDQMKMINNLRRVAKYYFIQTPAFVFPLEPHFLFPFFHWLPLKIRIWFVMHFNLGWFNKASNEIEAKKIVESIRIMKKKEFNFLQVNASIITEKFYFIPKSYIITNINLNKTKLSVNE